MEIIGSIVVIAGTYLLGRYVAPLCCARKQKLETIPEIPEISENVNIDALLSRIKMKSDSLVNPAAIGVGGYLVMDKMNIAFDKMEISSKEHDVLCNYLTTIVHGLSDEDAYTRLFDLGITFRELQHGGYRYGDSDKNSAYVKMNGNVADKVLYFGRGVLNSKRSDYDTVYRQQIRTGEKYAETMFGKTLNEIRSEKWGEGVYEKIPTEFNLVLCVAGGSPEEIGHADPITHFYRMRATGHFFAIPQRPSVEKVKIDIILAEEGDTIEYASARID
jgi:hypothetical protein